MKNLLFLIILLCISVNLYSQVSKLGFPFIKNYSNTDYDGNPQVWDIVQDQNGLIYIANSQGVIEFDGLKWTKYSIENKSTARKLFVDNKNNVFVGAENDFGFLDVNQYGEKYYKSLNYLLPDSFPELGDTYGIEQIGEKIVFVLSDAFIYFDYDTLKIIEGKFKNRTTFSSELGTYTFSRIYGIIEIGNDTVNQLSGSEFFQNIAALSMFPYKDNNYIIYSLINGFYFYNTETKSFENKIFGCSDFLINSYVFDIKSIKDKYFIFATYYNGVIITDYEFNIIKIINEANGLSADGCTDILVDNENNLWISTQNGISYIETSTPYSILDTRSGVPETVISAYFDNENIFLGSVSGMVYLNKRDTTNLFSEAINSQNMTWAFLKKNNQTFVCENDGLKKFQNGELSYFTSPNSTAWKIIEYQKKENTFLIGFNDGLGVYEFENNTFSQKTILELTGFKFRWFNCEDDGYIWDSDITKGLFRIKLNENLDSIVEVDLYDTLKGLPTNLKNHLYKLNGKLYAGTEKGIYIYNKEKDFFEPLEELNSQINYNDVWMMDFDIEGNIWFGGDKVMGVFNNQQDNSLIYNPSPFQRFDPLMMQYFYIVNSDTILFCFSECSYLYFPKVEKNYNPVFYPLIRKVSILNTADSLNIVFGGAFKKNNTLFYYQTSDLIPELEYNKNSLKFEFAAPLYQGIDKNLFSFYLEGYEEDFFNWTAETYKEYSNLGEGTYTFKLKAKNCYGIETETTNYTFTILAPWYRTWWSIIIYIILTLGLFFIVIKLYTRRLIKQKEHLEQVVKERTAEIFQQKEEILTQNEHLLQQKEEIEAQKYELERINEVLEKLSIVASETDNAVVIMDNKGNFEWINEGFTRLYGYNFEEFVSTLGKNVFEVSSNEDIKQILEKCRNEKISVNYESKTRAKNGELIWVQTTLTPIINSHNTISKFIAIDSDIRKLKEFETEIIKQKDELKYKNEQIHSSIRYAKTIQSAILPLNEQINIIFENFIIFHPKDIVSGDFYWFNSIDNGQLITENEKKIIVNSTLSTVNCQLSINFIAVLDCTGHGVPGAFMSMIGNTLLNEIVNSKKIYEPDEILENLDKFINLSLRQNVSENNDGMDVCFCRIDICEKNNYNSEKLYNLSFAGAKLGLYISDFQDKTINFLKGNRRSIGGINYKKIKEEFTVKTLELKKNDMIYLTSDGFCDQNNIERKRLGSARMIEIMKMNIDKTPEIQKLVFENELEKWMSGTDQRDDITLIGIKI